MSDDFRHEPQPNSPDVKMGWQPDEKPREYKKRPSLMKALLISFVVLLIMFLGAAGMLAIFGISVFRVNSINHSAWTTTAVAEIAVGERMPTSSEWDDSSSYSFSCDGDDVDRLLIEAAYANVQVKTHGSSAVRVDVINRNLMDYQAALEGNELIVKPNKKQLTSLSVAEPDEITIFVPESHDMDIDLTTAAGDTSLRDLSGNKIRLNIAAGRVTCSKLAYDDFVIKMSAGEMDIRDIYAGVSEISLTAGNLSLDGFEGDEAAITMAAGMLDGSDVSLNSLRLDMSAGNVELSGDLGNTNVKKSAGNMELIYKSQPEKIKLDSSLGGVQLYLPSDSEFRLETETSNGSVESDFRSVDDADYVVSVKLNAGKVEIRER